MNKEKYSVSEVKRLCEKKIPIIMLEEKEKNEIYKALSFLDKKIVDEVATGIILIDYDKHGSNYASHTTGSHPNYPEKRGFFKFSKKLFEKDKFFITETVFHEVAHHILKHQNISRTDKEDFEKQEREAEEQTEKWLKGAGITKETFK